MAYRTFVIPRTILSGPGALEGLSNVPGQRVLLVTAPGIRALGLVERVEKIVKKSGAETVAYDQVEPDPSKETARSVFALAQSFKPDLIIGLGGGSAMDTGKAAWVLYEHPDLAERSFQDFIREVSRRELRKKARYAAIATTSGTGSEVTSAAVITDRDVTPPVKAGFGSRHMVPDVAIADPELTVSMPPGITANTGLDAMVHACECYILISPSDMVDPLALWSARTIQEWLPRAVDNGEDLTARDKMHLASLQAGIAFSNGRLGLVHAAAHEIGATFGVPHGLANAFMLCPVFAFLYPAYRNRMSGLASHLGVTGPDDVTRVNNLLDALDRFKERVGIPRGMKDSGLDEQSFMAKVERISEVYVERLERIPVVKELTAAERRSRGIPASSDDMKQLFVHAWNGTRAILE